MPTVVRESDGSGMGVLAIVLVVAVFALLIGYFAWWQPRTTEASTPGPDVNIVTPAPERDTNVIPVPVPGPQGPAGAPGPAGPPGASGE